LAAKQQNILADFVIKVEGATELLLAEQRSSQRSIEEDRRA